MSRDIIGGLNSSYSQFQCTVCGEIPQLIIESMLENNIGPYGQTDIVS